MRVGGLNLTATGAYSTGLWLPGRVKWWGNEKFTTVRAVVCLGCGHVNLFATSLQEVREAVDEHPDWFWW